MTSQSSAHDTTLPADNAMSTVSSPPMSSLVTLHAGTQIPIKFDGNNFPAWKVQFSALLVGYNLKGYVDGSTPCPSSSHADYAYWIRQDSLIIHAIISSVAVNVVNFLGTVTTSKQAAWDILTQMYANRSRSRIMSLKECLATSVKGTKSVSEYLQSIKALSDELSVINCPVDELDLVIHTLNGIGREYRDISATIRARESPITFDELYEKLMGYEFFLKREFPTILVQQLYLLL